VSERRPPRTPNVDPALLKAVERVLRRERPDIYTTPFVDEGGEAGEGGNEARAGDETVGSGHGGEAGREQSTLSTPSQEGTVPVDYTRVRPRYYLLRERAAHERSEYFDGRIVAMSGGTSVHAAIAQNIGAHLYFRVGGGCRVYQSDLKVRSAGANAFMYPDVLVLCGEPGYVDRKRDVVTNPTIVFEVLSPSTEKHDRTSKAAAYRAIESLRAYVFVAQQHPRVEVYTRDGDGGWSCAVYQQYGDTVPLPAIGCELTLAEIYRNLVPAAAAWPPSTPWTDPANP
jgi:Uma2 family endonuclease